MTKTTIAFFGTMPYDKATFNEVNEEYGFDIKYYTGNLSHDNISLTHSADAVCVFVNDDLNAEIIAELKENGVKMIALRCAGYNNVDLPAAKAA
ncbi:MAG: 2-hydroxyacid dehydrogenase, partial [Porphyromonadaceae bacterium]|nr:2-hydroxyacid dehydrogenase [Porphyromonadaceae bacterium]